MAGTAVDRAPPRQELIEVERHGEPADQVDLLRLGDGDTTAGSAARLLPDARRLAEALFRLEPFASRRADFNVRGLCPPSVESGISRPSTGAHRRTPAATPTPTSGRSSTA
jgi:hypothetical protein